MANFDGHQAAAIAAAAVAAVWAMTAPNGAEGADMIDFAKHRWNASSAGAVAIAAYFGGIMPDVDLRHSMPSKALRVITGGLWSLASDTLHHRGWSHSWYGAACFSSLFAGVATAFGAARPSLVFLGAVWGCFVHFAVDDLHSFTKGRKTRPVMASTCLWHGYETGEIKNWRGFLVLTAIGAIGFALLNQ